MSSVVSPHPKNGEVSSVLDPTFQTREARLRFPPFYAVVGIYRLAIDPNLYKPIWDKVRHGTRRGLIVGFGWVCLSEIVHSELDDRDLIFKTRLS